MKDDTIVYEDPITIKFEEWIENQLKVLEHYLSLKCAENNKNLLTEKGTFSQHLNCVKKVWTLLWLRWTPDYTLS